MSVTEEVSEKDIGLDTFTRLPLKFKALKKIYTSDTFTSFPQVKALKNI